MTLEENTFKIGLSEAAEFYQMIDDLLSEMGFYGDEISTNLFRAQIHEKLVEYLELAILDALEGEEAKDLSLVYKMAVKEDPSLDSLDFLINYAGKAGLMPLVLKDLEAFLEQLVSEYKTNAALLDSIS